MGQAGGALGSAFRLGTDAASPEILGLIQRSLSELEAILDACRQDLQAANGQAQAYIIRLALRRARPLERKAGELVAAALHAAAPQSAEQLSARSLAEKHRQLHEEMRALEDLAKTDLKDVPRGLAGLLGQNVTAQAMVLHSRLEDLHTALGAWDAGRRAPAAACTPMSAAHEAAAVERSSAAFEDFRMSLRQSGQSSAMHAAALVKALPSASAWRDPQRIQATLRERQAFLYVHLECGRHFLAMSRQKERWPEADALALQWRETLQRTLGIQGAVEWMERSKMLKASAAAADGTTGSGWYYGLSQEAMATFQDMGVLRIRQIRASNLRRADFWDASDPYVIFEFGGRRACTSVVYDNEDNPQWAGEEIIFEVESLRNTPYLGVEVWDWDGFSVDDPLGRVDEYGGGLDLLNLLEGIGPVDVHAGIIGRPPLFARRQGCRLQLRGAGAGIRGGTIEFEVLFSEGGNADPFALHLGPEGPDPVMQLLADVGRRLEEHRADFGKESEGFFLPKSDWDSEATVQKTEALHVVLDVFGAHVSAQTTSEVQEYNRALDRLSLLTSSEDPSCCGGGGMLATEAPPKMQGGGTTSSDIWSASLFGEGVSLRMTSQQLVRLREQIRAVERKASHDPALYRAISCQDDLLPTIGAWSTDRRRRLRDQVFLAELRLTRLDVCGVPAWVWQPCILTVVLCTGTVLCTLSVVHNPSPLRDFFMLAACLMVIVCTVSPWLSSGEHPEPWHMRLLDTSSGYLTVPTSEI